MATDLTAQQRAAVDLRGTSVVLASGAGCGKTHVLTARYLSHLARDHAEVAQVVAVTFTERAARQMRSRIRAAVDERLRAADPGSDPAAKWARHKRDLDGAPVATIHGFCGTLLRQYAPAAGLDPAFQVLDEPLAANLRVEALKDELYRLLTDESGAADDLRELVALFGWQATRDAVDDLLRDPDPPAWAAWLARSPDDIAADWVGRHRRELLPAWVGYLCAASAKVAGCLSLLERVTPATPDAKRAVARIRAEVPDLHSAPDLAAAVEELCDLAKVGRTGKKDWPDELVYAAVRDAYTDFRGDLGPRLSLFTDAPDKVPEAAEVGRRFVRVAAAADAAYRGRKRRAAALDFHDLLVLARDLLRDQPGVAAAVRERFRFVLLDELQDTDPVQMELVGLLCGGGLHHGKLFAVGDAKQSIYRFRGAEVGLFRGLRAAVPDPGRLGLTKNFRSQPGVLAFVNALCSRRIPDYEPLVTDVPQGAFGNVELLWSVPADRRDAGPTESAADVRGREADAIARRVVELIAAGEPRVRDGGGFRPVRPKDVVLLFRSMTQVATYEAALRRHGLDYYLVGGRAFFAQQEVYDLLNLLRAVENPQDGPALAGTLRSPFCGLSDEALFLVGTHPDGLWAGLFDADRFASLPADQKPAVARARRSLTRWRGLKDRLPIARLLGAVFADSGYDAALQFESLADRKLANLWKLTDLARDFDRTGFGLAEFTARLADLVARQPREEQAATQPEESDAVKLMSVHQAKGLEFPVVIVPDIGALGRGSQYPVARWHRQLGCLVRLPADVGDDDAVPFSDFPDRLGRAADQLADWHEDLRVLYVACTRARDLLVLSAGLPEPLTAPPAGGPTRPPAKAASHWVLALAERFDLRTGECVADDIRPEDCPRVGVRVVGPGAAGPGVGDRDAPGPADRLYPVYVPLPRTLPPVVSLLALERFSLGDPIPSVADDSDASDTWRPLRDRLAPAPPHESVFWAVLRRWDWADLDGWRPLLADALADLPDPAAAERLAAEVKPLFERLAGLDLRRAVAAADEAFLDLEVLFDLGSAAAATGVPVPRDAPPLPAVRGLVDLLFRDAGGWHLYGVHLTERPGRHPWRDRGPWLAAQAWAVGRRFGGPPGTVGLVDLVGGGVFAGPRQGTTLAAGIGHLIRAAGAVAGRPPD